MKSLQLKGFSVFQDDFNRVHFCQKIPENTSKHRFFGESLGKIEHINQRLKQANIPVRIRQRGNSLYLRCSKLTPKPGDSAGKRDEIPFGPASAGDRTRLETEAHALWKAVVERRFDWSSYDSSVKKASIVADIVTEFERHYLSVSQCSKRTFQKH